MKKIFYFLILTFLIPSTSHAGTNVQAKQVNVNTSSFTKNLNSTDTDVQKALNTLDQTNGAGGGGTWGSITGTLSNQTDLQNALNAKQNSITTGTTAQYLRGDLSLATFPTSLSQFTNSPGFITTNQNIVLSGILSGSGNTTIPVTAASGYYMPTTSDQSNWNGKQSNLNLLAGTYVNGNACTYSSSGTLINCNSPLPQGSQWITANTNDVYLSGNGNVGIGTSATTNAALSVMNGPVGVGTTNPTALNSQYFLTAQNNFSGLREIAMINASANSTAVAGIEVRSIDNDGFIRNYPMNYPFSGLAGRTLLQNENGNGVTINTFSGGDVKIGASGSTTLDIGINNVGINTLTPGKTLDVNGTIRTTGFILSSSPTNGYVLTSDAGGNGTWQPSTGGVVSYPGAGIANSTGSGWGTSYSTSGSGTVVALATSPTLVTPALGVATATSVNKLAITAPATNATLTIANGKTATINNTLTLAGTDSTTMTFPTTSATVARTDASNVFTGHQTIEGITSTGATGTGNLVFASSPTLTTPNIGAATATSLGITGMTPSRPVVTNGSNLIASGLFAGSSGVFATASGTLNPGHCVSIDTGNNFVDAGSSCGVTGPGGSSNQIQVNSSGSFTGYSGFVFNGTNLGIGSTTPGQKLDVQGTLRTTGFNLSTSPTNGYVLTTDASGNGTWQAGGGSSQWTVSGSNIYNSNAGNVGVGSTVPGQKLDVQGTLRSIGGIFTGNVGIGTSTALNQSLTVQGAMAIQGSSTPAYITGVNVGIGSVNPTQQLDVQGTAKMTGFILNSSPTNGYVLTSDANGNGTWTASTTGSGTVNSASSGQIAVYPSNGTTVGGNANFIYNGTNVGIGTTSAPTDILTLNSSTGGDLSLMNNGNPTSEFNSLGSSGASNRLLQINMLGVTSGGDNWIQYRFNGASNKWYFGDDGSSKAFFQTSHDMRFYANMAANTTSDAPQLVIPSGGTAVQFPNCAAHTNTVSCWATSGAAGYCTGSVSGTGCTCNAC